MTDDRMSPEAIDDLRREVDSLRRKIETLPLIEQAKGMLMQRYDIKAALSFRLLTRWSQALELRVSVVSELLLQVAGLGEASKHPVEHEAALIREMGGPWRPGPAHDRQGR